MQIDYLWHSEFLLSIKNTNNEIISILCDSWLSNYAFWDFMERNPQISIDYDKFKDLDAIYLSHAHCDHIDPYTLIDLYKNIKNPPILLIPNTIEYLIPLFKKYLSKWKIQILNNNETYNLKWIDIKWIIFENNYITNEDDVMTISFSNNDELLYSDVDTLPPETKEASDILYDLFTQKKYKRALYLSTRNELEWNFKILDLKTKKQRQNFEKEYIDYRKEEIEYNYTRFDYDLYWVNDIQKLSYFMKALIWQGIIYPSIIDPNFQKLRILSLKQEADIERTIARNNWRNFIIEWLIPWKSYDIIDNKINLLWNIDFLRDFKYILLEQDFSVNINKIEKYWALNNELRDFKLQKSIILSLINNRFLAYRLANTEDPFKNAILNSKNRTYTIKVKYWLVDDYYEEFYSYNFSSFKFFIDKFTSDFNEDYWANDLEDFYMGSQELYSNFLHKFTQWKTYRLWTSLWANFLNNDLVYKKFDKHFSKAIKWDIVDDFVLEKYK